MSEKEMSQKVAFIGLGNMGYPMCAQLLRNGFAVYGYDVSSSARDRLKELGGNPCSTVADAVRNADYVVSMVPGGKQVREIYEGTDGVIENARPATILIDCSTIDIENAKAVNAAAAAVGLEMVDAPVSGAQIAATEGRLIFMIGGTTAGYEKCLPVLKAMGTNFYHIGAAGSGQALKICNNMMMGISMVGISEVLTLAGRLGLDHQIVYDVMSKGSGRCWALQEYCPVPGPVPSSPASKDYTPGFTVTMMLKDMRLAQQAATGSSAATPLAGAAIAFYQMLAAAGHSERDFSIVFKLISGDLPPASGSEQGRRS